MQLHEEQPKMMAVQVPEGMQGGMKLQVQTPAGMMQVQIPQGLAPGQIFHMPLAPPPVAPKEVPVKAPVGKPADAPRKVPPGYHGAKPKAAKDAPVKPAPTPLPHDSPAMRGAAADHGVSMKVGSSVADLGVDTGVGVTRRNRSAKARWPKANARNGKATHLKVKQVWRQVVATAVRVQLPYGSVCQ